MVDDEFFVFFYTFVRKTHFVVLTSVENNRKEARKAI